MVGEFPELQGVMGGYYSDKEGIVKEIFDDSWDSLIETNHVFFAYIWRLQKSA